MSPDANTDYRYVYQGSSVGFTAAQLVANDVDPQGQVLTVVAVSEPANNGTLTGILERRLRRTRPAARRRLVGTDHRTQLSRHRHRRSCHPGEHHRDPHPRHRRHQPTPVARGDVARTNAGTRRFRCSWSATISIPTVTVSAWSRWRRRPTGRRRSLAVARNVSYTPQRRVLRGRDHHLHDSATARDSSSIGTLTVWVDTGVSSAAQSPDAQDRLPLRVSGFFGRVHHRSSGRQRQRSAGSGVEVVAVSEPSNNGSVDRVVERRVRLHARRRGRAWSAPIIDSTISSPTPTVMSPKATS